MLLYTVVPLNRIYQNQTMSSYLNLNQRSKECDTDTNTTMNRKEFDIPHGHIETRLEGNRYIIQRVMSTDMEDYLKDEYSLGMEYIKME